MKFGTYTDWRNLLDYAWENEGVIHMDFYHANGFIAYTGKEYEDTYKHLENSIVFTDMCNILRHIHKDIYNNLGFSELINFIDASFFEEKLDFYKEFYTQLNINTYHVSIDIEGRRSFINNRDEFIKGKSIYKLNEGNIKLLEITYNNMVSDDSFNQLINIHVELSKDLGKEPDEWIHKWIAS